MVKLTQGHYDFIADVIGPQVAWPSHLHSIADELEKRNPKFKRDMFLKRATAAWEEHNEIPKFEDEIPH